MQCSDIYCSRVLCTAFATCTYSLTVRGALQLAGAHPFPAAQQEWHGIPITYYSDDRVHHWWPGRPWWDGILCGGADLQHQQQQQRSSTGRTCCCCCCCCGISTLAWLQRLRVRRTWLEQSYNMSSQPKHTVTTSAAEKAAPCAWPRQ